MRSRKTGWLHNTGFIFEQLEQLKGIAPSLLLCHFTAEEDGTALFTGRCLTYQPRQLPAPETHADAHVEAVGVGEALVALRHCDVDGGGQEDGHVHRDDGPGPGTDGGE